MPSSPYGYFEIDGEKWPYLPDSWETNFQEFGARVIQQNTTSAERVVIAYKRGEDAQDTKQHYRRVQQQSFSFSFNNVPLEFAEHLRILQTLTKKVTIRFNDLMSRTNTRCYGIGDNIVYFTPTWPIRPEGWEIGETQNWTGMVRVNGSPSGDATVYPEMGAIVFSPALMPSDIVTISYEWVMTCRIGLGFTLSPEDDRARVITIRGKLFQVAPSDSDYDTGYPS